MYLEMLQQRYGAALEKQAMEKQALSPMQLMQMGRSFAGRGKLERFNQLLNKRNAAIKKVFDSRRDKARSLRDLASQEVAWLGSSKGPISRQYSRAKRRFIPATDESENMRSLWNFGGGNPKAYVEALSGPNTASTVTPKDLANLSSFLRQYGY